MLNTDLKSVWSSLLGYESYSYDTLFQDYLKFLSFKVDYSVIQNILKIQIPVEIPPMSLMNILIQNIKNPDKTGGTPAIQMNILCNNFSIASNESFAQVGISAKADFLDPITVKVQSQEKTYWAGVAGALNSYIFK